MRFLADESMDMRVIRALRFEGHDVRSVLEEFRGLPDEDVVAVAKEDDRVLLTEDRDFGQLLFVRLQASLGAVLYPIANAVARSTRRGRCAIRSRPWRRDLQCLRGDAGEFV